MSGYEVNEGDAGDMHIYFVGCVNETTGAEVPCLRHGGNT